MTEALHMTLGLLPNIGGGLADTAASGQIDRLLRYYLPAYLDRFERLFYFSYLTGDSLAAHTADPRLAAVVTVLPKLRSVSSQRYAFELAFAGRAWLRQCHILRVFHAKGAIPAWIAKQRYGIPYVTTYGYRYDEFARLEGHHVTAQLWRRLEPVILRGAAGVIATTQDLAVYAGRFAPADRVHLIPNGVDTRVFAPSDNDVCATPPIILFVGRLTNQKNLETLIQAVARLPAPVQLRLIGDGPLRNQLYAAAQALGVDVRFLGVVPYGALLDHYRTASAFVLPSLIEGHPKVLIEAMSCALPCVVSDCDGNRLLTAHGETGLLFEPADVAGLAQHLEQVLGDRAFAVAMGRRARAQIVAKYDLHRILARETDLLATLARRPD